MRSADKNEGAIYKNLKLRMSKITPKVKLHFKLPTRYDDNTRIAEKEFVDVKNYFMRTYGGLSIGSKTLGYWMDSNVEYRDTTIEYMVLVEKKRFAKQVKPNIEQEICRFKEQFKQLGILCYYHDVCST